MNPIVLLAWPEGSDARRLQQALRGKLSTRVVVEQAFHQREAEDLLATGRYQLLVTHADLPSDNDDTLFAGNYLGLGLFAWMKERQLATIPGIVVGVFEPKLSSIFGRLSNVLLIPEGVDSDAKLVEAAERSLAGSAPDSQFNLLKVTIVADTRQDVWRWVLHGEGTFSYEDQGTFVINDLTLKYLTEESVSMADEDGNWRKHLKFLGRNLTEKIFTNNVNLRASLDKAWAKLDGKVDKTTICFHISGQAHPIFFEALVSEDVQNEFWMLKAPIYRRLHNACSRPALFSCGSRRENQQLNCLIVEADAFGPVEGLFEDNRQLTLDRLDVEKDCEDLERLFLDQQTRFGIGKVLRVTKKLVGERSYFGVLREILEQDTWHLVHYSGHSFYDKREDKGYLFFPAAAEGEMPEKFDIGILSEHLRDAQLVFLSGCRSSDMSFIASLAKCEIPAAIGFRFKVKDLAARKYALEFYKQLFETRLTHSRCLQHAFVQTRQIMHDLDPEDPIWANPLLLVQSK